MYKRVLLKLSGEALAGDAKFGIDENTMAGICSAVKELHDMGVQVSIVVGGGNYCRLYGNACYNNEWLSITRCN